jgi:hypothetical protein
VWDEGEQTAIQSPLGGTKIAWDTWSDLPAGPGDLTSRERFDLVSVRLTEDVERLLSLGATLEDRLPDGVRLVDPDGNPFTVRLDSASPTG